MDPALVFGADGIPMGMKSGTFFRIQNLVSKDGITRSFEDFASSRHQDLVKDQSLVACEKN